MNSFLAAALRWIFPFAARGATVDFFGTDVVGFFEADVFLDELFEPDDLVLDDERVVEDRDGAPRLLCASDPMGSSKSAAIRIKTIRGRIAPWIMDGG